MTRKHCFAPVLALIVSLVLAFHADAQSVFDRLKQKAKDKVANSVSTSPAATSTTSGATTSAASPANTRGGGSTAAAAPGAGGTSMGIGAYTSYDFVPGDKTLFADDFSSTTDGDFPVSMKLIAGQAVVNHQQGHPALLLTAGDYGTFTRLSPRIKPSENYLGDAWTLEFDTYSAMDQGCPKILFTVSGDKPQLAFDTNSVRYTSAANQDLSGRYPADIADRAYNNHWHHVSIVYKAPQLKVYVDQYRVLYVPDTGNGFHEVYFAGIGSPDKPVVYRDVRLAAGGGMNFVGQKFTNAKIVSHGITFDTDSATLRPESMGTLNQIKKLMDADPSLRFEIDGHTDNSGTPSRNLELSGERAEAVKSQLVAMGVDGTRLSTKGFGDTKPTSPNNTPEQRADNRRVEFVKN